jgi:uncharacterized membrane protein
MDDIILIVVSIVVFFVIMVGLALYSLESTRNCRMEAAAKGYNVKEICE